MSEANDERIPRPDWQRLPDAARLTYRLAPMLSLAVPPLVAGTITSLVLGGRNEWVPPLLFLAAALALSGGWILGGLRHRRTRYRLDDDGLSVRRGLCWQSETLVPRTRVQHLDLERGPLERRLGLATLVAHTAGTRSSALRLSGLDFEQARALRDALVDREAGADDDAL